jgi:hypothetical protein
MKRIDILITFVFATMLLACTKPSIEDKAKKHLREAAEIIANDPTSLIIQGENVIFSNDSVCFISYVAKDKNELGNYTTNNCEYFYVHSKDLSFSSEQQFDYHGAYYVDDKRDSKQKVADMVDYLLNEFLKENPNSNGDDIEKERASLFYMEGISLACDEQRKVSE